ncbi:pre-mRNA-splicing factor slu7 [Sclerotinia borealis F-4128]|uniref:Pre-mRNA-splicing factor SLU7 n=1 Tax=Sclerotinia borealis (strain F-4128) TaxID=1432307 RepID=W9C2A0_SCLBF|nr:pre-mRNA-splicing factor slu7 [Sclerotinia borealis F-4128]
MPPAGTQPRKPEASAANKDQNEYIPAFIAKKPFYVDDDDNTDYLEHQRLQKAQSDQSIWYDRGKKLGPAATKFRKGACENCGAMTHKIKDCLDRPRAKGAKWTGKDIQADEVIQDVDLGWDAKRDRWNGYNAKEYKAVTDEYAQLEELKKQVCKGDGKDGEEAGEDGDDDGAKYAEESDMGRHQSTSTRQLRIREDTAKYLLNLDLDSAKYDPKTRSMVDSGATADTAAALVAEEGFLKASGDAAEFEKAQKYAWESQEKAGDTKLHLQANPTSGEYYRRKEKEEAETKRNAHKKMLLEKYGKDSNPVAAKLRDAAVMESERFIEYDELGGIKGAPKASAKSKYPEDVLINNHTSVWGSWWSQFKWGYACCHSMVKNSYCVGEAGKRAMEDAEHARTGNILLEGGAEEIETAKEEIANPTGAVSDLTTQQTKKRTAEEMHSGVSEEDMDAWKKKRVAADDPMNAFLGKDELV